MVEETCAGTAIFVRREPVLESTAAGSVVAARSVVAATSVGLVALVVVATSAADTAVCAHRLALIPVAGLVDEGEGAWLNLGVTDKPIEAKMSSSSSAGVAFFGCVARGFGFPRLVISVGVPPIEFGRNAGVGTATFELFVVEALCAEPPETGAWAMMP
jgi:hypothetical protein